MSNYYEKRKAGVNIAHALMNLNWNVYGYKKDESDSMTDYYSPAYWDGIAEKNGFVLVVNNNYPSEEKEIKKYNYTKVSFADRDKISKLEAMTQENGATAGEEENAKILIEKIKNKESEGVAEFEIIGKIPAHMGNPGKCIWHIEKDGKIYDKGNALTKYAGIPADYEYDYVKMEYKKNYDTWSNGEKKVLTEEQVKAANDFKALILRFERVVNNMSGMGDGTAETEQKGLEQQQQKEGYEKVIVLETKTKLKMVLEDRKYIQVGDYITLPHHGGYWKVKSQHMQKGTWKGVQMEKNAFVYEIVGKESRGFQELKNCKRYYDYEERMLRDVENGKTKIYTLQEVEVTEEVEKWVKIEKSKNTYNKKSEVKPETAEQPITETTNTETVDSNISEYELIITADVDTRDNSPLWVVKIIDKLSKEEYKNVASEFGKLKGYYSKFKHGFIFKYDPSAVLKSESVEQEQQETEQTTEEAITEEIRTPEQETADQIVDMSVNIITELGIDGSTIANNEQYKEKLYNAIKDNNIAIKDTVINCLKSKECYNNLVDILESIQRGYYQPIKDGFIYDCHFKEWELPMEQIQESISLMNINFIDMGNKIGFEGLTAEQTRNIKNISDINGSILFIDSEIPEIVVSVDNSNMETEQHEKQHQEKTTEELNSNFNFDDDILSKFDNIEINNNSRISADDEVFCKEQENIYKKLVESYNKFSLELQEISVISNEHGKKYGTQTEIYFHEKPTAYYHSLKPSGLDETITKMKNQYIKSVCVYFSDKHNVTIDDDKISKKYDQNVTYDNIIDEIFLQLGGFTFEEKAVKEIKENIMGLISNKGYKKLSIKNNKVAIIDFFYIDSSDAKYGNIRISWNYKENFEKLLTAITHFEQGETSNVYRELLNGINKYKNDELIKEHELNDIKAKSLKLFKNGKIEILFKSAEYARKFAKEYLGYIEKAA